MDYENLSATKQDILISTVHHQESVVEIYLNQERSLVTELKHLSNHRARVYEYEVNDYLVIPKASKSIDQKIIELCQN